MQGGHCHLHEGSEGVTRGGGMRQEEWDGVLEDEGGSVFLGKIVSIDREQKNISELRGLVADRSG